MLSRDPVVQELLRRLVAKRGVAAAPIAKDFDIGKEVGDGLGVRLVAGAMDPFVLQAVEEALARRVVPAVCLAAHRAGHPVLGKLVLERLTGVLGGFNPSSQHILIGGCDAYREETVERYLSLAEREQIALLRARDEGVREIARQPR